MTTKDPPCSWMCREKLQKYDNYAKKVVAKVDTTCSDTVICAINVRGFITVNPLCERIRLDVEVDRNPAESYIYDAHDLRVAGYEMLTDDIRVQRRSGQIKVYFEAWGPEQTCDPRRLTLTLQYYKDDENLYPEDRIIYSPRPPKQGYEFRQKRLKYKTINGSTSRQDDQDKEIAHSYETHKREDSDEEGEIIEEITKRDAIRRSYHRRIEHQVGREQYDTEDTGGYRRRQRSVSREERSNLWKKDKRVATPMARDDKARRDLSPTRSLQRSNRRNPKDQSTSNSKIECIKQANERLVLEIEQLQLLKAQKQLKKKLEKLKEEVNQVEEKPLYLRLPRSSSLTIDSRHSTCDVASSQCYEPLSPHSFLEEVAESCNTTTTDGQFLLTPTNEANLSLSPAAFKQYTPLLQQPRDDFNIVSPPVLDISISEADLNNLRHIRQQLYSSRQKKSSL